MLFGQDQFLFFLSVFGHIPHKGAVELFVFVKQIVFCKFNDFFMASLIEQNFLGGEGPFGFQKIPVIAPLIQTVKISQAVDGAAQQVIFGTLQQLTCGIVDIENFSKRIGPHHPLWGAVQHELGDIQGFFVLFALGNILHNAVDEDSIGIHPGIHARLQVDITQMIILA